MQQSIKFEYKEEDISKVQKTYTLADVKIDIVELYGKEYVFATPVYVTSSVDKDGKLVNTIEEGQTGIQIKDPDLARSAKLLNILKNTFLDFIRNHN